MSFDEKIEQLRQLTSDSIKPLLSDRVIIADAPYYDNIGDILIWRGAVDFLRENTIELLHCYGAGFFPFPSLDKDITIILTGGGNFGDLWRVFQDTRLEIIASYPENRIVMLPQSIYYQEEALIEKDSELMARHPDLHLFARDQASYDILSSRFNRNHIYLAPDMAFCIDTRLLARYRHRDIGKRLYLLRSDKELNQHTPAALQEADVNSDWPKPEKTKRLIRNLKRARRISRDLLRYGVPTGIVESAIEVCGNRFIRENMTEKGCKFLEPFSLIATTRLHTMILSVLLHKPVEYIDNTYGKLSAFAETWLHDLPEVKAYGRN